MLKEEQKTALKAFLHGLDTVLSWLLFYLNITSLTSVSPPLPQDLSALEYAIEEPGASSHPSSLSTVDPPWHGLVPRAGFSLTASAPGSRLQQTLGEAELPETALRCLQPSAGHGQPHRLHPVSVRGQQPRVQPRPRTPELLQPAGAELRQAAHHWQPILPVPLHQPVSLLALPQPPQHALTGSAVPSASHLQRTQPTCALAGAQSPRCHHQQVGALRLVHGWK